jgi:hypothetical protein
MNKTQNFDEELLKISTGPGLYMLQSSYKNDEIVYPFAPTSSLQRSGGSTIEGVSLVDIDTELMGLNRINSKDPDTKYKPKNTKFKYNHLKDGFFETEHTRLTNSLLDLRTIQKNRFDYIPVSAVKYSIEPFKLLGENTYLDTIDNFQEC